MSNFPKALLPLPQFDIQTLEPLGVPPQVVRQDGSGVPPMRWWMDEPPTWEAFELDLGDDSVLVLDATDPFPVND